MIGFLRGRVYSTDGMSLLLDVHGVGYEVFMALPVLQSLSPGDEVFVYTRYIQKEDMVAIFGFLTEKSKEIFEILTGVSGMGPKTALGILSHIAEDDLIEAVREGDLAGLVRIPGIGNKTAQRLIFELQDKLSVYTGAFTGSADQKGAKTPKASVYSDAESALLFLGYGKKEIGEVLTKLVKGKNDVGLDALIRDALKELGR